MPTPFWRDIHVAASDLTGQPLAMIVGDMREEHNRKKHHWSKVWKHLFTRYTEDALHDRVL